MEDSSLPTERQARVWPRAVHREQLSSRPGFLTFSFALNLLTLHSTLPTTAHAYARSSPVSNQGAFVFAVSSLSTGDIWTHT